MSNNRKPETWIDAVVQWGFLFVLIFCILGGSAVVIKNLWGLLT